MLCGATSGGMDDSYENSGKVSQKVTNASQRPLVFMLRGAARAGMGNSHENPLSGRGKKVSLPGWVLPVPEQPTPAPLQRRGIIFTLKGAPLGGHGQLLSERAEGIALVCGPFRFGTTDPLYRCGGGDLPSWQ